jgi:hypothetical protein
MKYAAMKKKINLNNWKRFFPFFLHFHLEFFSYMREISLTQHRLAWCGIKEVKS